MENLPKVGQILYQQKENESGEVINASLLYIDTEPVHDTGLYVTWIAQMENFNGNGLEVYSDATSGESRLNQINRIASDEDIKFFISVIKKSNNSEDALHYWLHNIKSSEGYALLLPEEKERLERIIKESL